MTEELLKVVTQNRNIYKDGLPLVYYGKRI